MVKSKYSVTFWINLSLSILFLIGLFSVVALGKISLFENSKKIPLPNWLFFLLLLILVCYLLYSTLKAAPVYIISDSKIQKKRLFRKPLIITEDVIEEIIMFTRSKSMGLETITSSIKLKNKAVLKIPNISYSNSSKLRVSLKNYFFKKIKPYFSENKKANDDYFEEKFAGNFLTSFNTLLLFGFIIGLSVSTYKTLELHPERSLIMLIPIAIFYFAFGFQMYFFIIRDNSLIIKNHFLPWISKKYDLKEIIIILRKSVYKQSDALTIITGDLQIKSFGAGSLKERHWEQLMEKFKSIGIQISLN